jgi:tetratricopeptide (TPR) repeat protein
MAFTVAACCLVLVSLGGCGGGDAPTTVGQNTNTPNHTASASTNSQGARTPVVVASPGASRPAAAASGGEPVDTSKHDAEIKRLENEAKKKPSDQATRRALATAYTNRGDALTGVRQYRAALGDYRRALRNDPGNEQARQMAGTITGILKSMGRDIPPEGEEPAPLPLKQ